MENTQVGPFLIIKRLGNNRRQKVFHARQVDQNRDVALKFIKVPPSVPWHKALDKLEREFNQLTKLRHPNLVKVYGAGVEDERVFFATELIEGESIAAILGRRGRLAHDQVVAFGMQISEFLVFLHGKDLIHSKLTPEKILITSDDQVKISDLRLNRAKRRRWDSTRRRELDLAAYMAPEQFTTGATEKSDFYALGVMLFEMLSGRLPYPPDTMGRMTRNKLNAPVPSVATHVMNCPIWLDKIITQMLDPDPRKRPHSAQAINLAFAEIQKIDATRKAAVDQMTSGFNPLTAGEDKSEANRLLHGTDPDAEEGPPFYQTIWFQVTALLLIGLLGLLAFLPQSDQAIVDSATQLVQSEDPDDWSEARSLLEGVMSGDDELATKATSLYFQARRKSLVAKAQSGKVSRVDNEHLQQFVKAYRLEEQGMDEDAADIYAQLIADVPSDGDHRHVYLESKVRYDKLSVKFEWPSKPIDLLKLIAKCENVSTEPELIEAQNKLGNLLIRFAGEPTYEGVIEAAEKARKQVKERLLELRAERNE